MQKTYAGARLRRLREERGIPRTALGLSTSYVNRPENDELLPHTPFTAREFVSLHLRLRGIKEQLEQYGPGDPGVVEPKRSYDTVAKMLTLARHLSTLQRPGQRGVPSSFVRTDCAGNVPKHHSANTFHFTRVGSSCPLWVVHDAFSSPDRILTQVSQMPDGGLRLDDPDTTVPMGAGCKVCDRPSCTQRAFPHLGRTIRIDENNAGLAPYAATKEP